MKKIKLVFLFVFIVVLGCNPENSNKNFFSGTYVRQVHNEFSVGRDTLVINRFNENNYSIIHCGSYQRILEGKLLPAASFHENWSAVYDSDTRTLQETRHGKVLSFYSGKNLLKLGSSIYKKIQ